MKYSQVQDLTLGLLRQRTIAGTPVLATYNCQADDLLQIPGLVNDALMEIATRYAKIKATLSLDGLPAVDLGKEIRYELPDDFYQWCTGSVFRSYDGRLIPATQFRLQGRKYILVPGDVAKDYRVDYYRLPRMLPERPTGDEELDALPEALRAIPYYVASVLEQSEDPARSAILNNMYQDKMNLLHPGVSAEIFYIDPHTGYAEVE